MSATPTMPKSRKYASLAVLGGAAILLAIGVIAPLATSFVEAREAIAADAERLAGLRAKRVDLAELEAALKSTKARAAQRSLYVDAPSGAAAWERLQAIIGELSSTYDATVSSSRMSRLEDDSSLKAVRGEFVLLASRAQVSRLMLAVENNRPLLFIEKLQLEPKRGEEDRIQVTASIRLLASIGQPKAASR